MPACCAAHPVGPCSTDCSLFRAALQIYKTFKQNELLKGVTWDCKRGERVGLVGVNGAGKTTQLQILLGNVDADSGDVLKARRNLHIAYLNQEFDISPERTVRQELSSAFAEGMAVAARTEEIQKELEECTDDMERMSTLLDELDKLGNQATDLDMATIDKKLDKMMPELGFSPEDNDRCAPRWGAPKCRWLRTRTLAPPRSTCPPPVTGGHMCSGRVFILRCDLLKCGSISWSHWLSAYQRENRRGDVDC
jgi:ABC transporter